MNTITAAITGSTADVAAATNGAATVTYAAQAQVAHVISGIAYSLSAAPAGIVNLAVTDGGTTIFSLDIAIAGPLWGVIKFPRPKKGSVNSALVVTLGAGGTGIAGKVSVLSKWTEGT